MKVNFLDTVSGKTYHGSDEKWYSTSAVAKMLKDPKLKGNIKLRRFLSENEIIDDYGLHPNFVNEGYFLEHPSAIRGGKVVYSIKVSRKGIEYLKSLLNESNNSNQNNN
jgi:hypothetical protein